MGVGYAVDELTSAVTVLASSEDGLQSRLQRAWDGHVQNLWTSVYLPEPLNEKFKALWERYNAPSEDRFSTVLRDMSAAELVQAVAEIVDLTAATIAAHARGEEPAPKPARK